jgi:PhoPQ-activated pathogenicity-related protein
MVFRWGLICSLMTTGCFGTALADAPAADALSAYVARKDDVFTWEEKSRLEMLGIRMIQFTLTSQNWHGTTWKHKLVLLLPRQVHNPQHALLFINGGSWRGDEVPAQPEKPRLSPEVIALAAAAEQLSSPIAILSNVPFQPIEGKREDALIAYTFDQYLKTGDPTWPLLLPMAKSAVRAMDAVQTYLHDKENVDVKSFTVAGASKRGWTTWLTAAADPRVSAAAPMVIDMLNMSAQAKHQVDVWGEYSLQVRDYTELDIPTRLRTELGQVLQKIVDPFSYRDKITQPKMIILGANDPYWPVDSSNQYWDQLKGEKFLTIVPNAGHDLARDFPRAIGSIIAIHQYSSGERKMPKMTWQFTEGAHNRMLRVSSDTPPTSAGVWIARMPGKDFRQAKWTREEMNAAQGGYQYSINASDGEYVALFGELVFPGKPPLYLSTNVKVLGK